MKPMYKCAGKMLAGRYKIEPFEGIEFRIIIARVVNSV
jgi:hypothetical protein